MTDPVRVEAWGMAQSAFCRVERPRTAEEAEAVFRRAARDRSTVGLRGAGCSYGDAALNGGGVLLETTAMSRVLAWDPAEGLATVEPGATVGDLWRRTVGDGWWPAVVPGTMAPTWGGCLGMNVHGKNHWKAGAVGDHVEAFEILLPTLERLRCSRDENADLFRAAVGGAGLLGLFTEITLRLKRVRSGLLEVEALAAASIEETMDLIEAHLGRSEYTIGWIDCFDARGRGAVHVARHLDEGEDPDPAATLRVEAQDLPERLFLVLPRGVVAYLLAPFVNDLGMRLVNAAKWGAGRATHGARYRQSHAAFHFLLDYVPDWKRGYRPGGLIQIQPFIPREAARAAFAEILRLSRARGHVPYLGVLKRDRPSDFLLTPYGDGWSLALDYAVPAASRDSLWSLAREIERITAEAGGRFYFAKDLTMSPETLRRTYPAEALAAFGAMKERCDPDGILRTDLHRRLFG